MKKQCLKELCCCWALLIGMHYFWQVTACYQIICSVQTIVDMACSYLMSMVLKVRVSLICIYLILDNWKTYYTLENFSDYIFHFFLSNQVIEYFFSFSQTIILVLEQQNIFLSPISSNIINTMDFNTIEAVFQHFSKSENKLLTRNMKGKS